MTGSRHAASWAIALYVLALLTLLAANVAADAGTQQCDKEGTCDDVAAAARCVPSGTVLVSSASRSCTPAPHAFNPH